MATDLGIIEVTMDRYGHGDVRTYTFEHGPWYCINCGSSTVWMERGSDDYYTGESYYCITCRCEFSFQGPQMMWPGRLTEFMDALVVAAKRER